MKRYGNIRFNRRVVVIVCMLVVAVNFLMSKQTVRAYDYVTYTKIINAHFTNEEGKDCDYVMSVSVGATKPFYSVVFKSSSDSSFMYGFVIPYGCKTDGNFVERCNVAMYVGGVRDTSITKPWGATGIYLNKVPSSFVYGYSSKCSYISSNCDYEVVGNTVSDAQQKFLKFLNGESVDGVVNGNTFSSHTYDSSLGFLAGVELQQIHDKSKEIKGSPDGSGLMETIIYNDKTTTGVDLKNGDYKVEVAWADAYLNAKKTAYYSEDKKKTSICKFDAKLNCKSSDSLKRYYYSVLDANKKCKDNSTEGFEPSMFDIITKHLSSQPTYWYRIITKDNRYSGWVKLGVKGGGVDDITFPQDTYDNDDNKVDADHGGYHKDNSKEAIGSGDSKDEAIEDSVADSQRKDDNNVINNGSSKDLWDSLKEFVKGVESVPIMIADLFSFLPSWCLGLVASGFALMISLMIINCIKS